MSTTSSDTAILQPHLVLGWAAMSAALVAWAGFSLSMRGIGSSELTPSDVAFLRFEVAALVLLPFLPPKWRELKAVPRMPAAMIAVGAGLPFFVLVAAGGRFSSAAHVSALVAGTAPLAVAILARALLGQRFGYLPGLIVILIGIALLIAGLGNFGPQTIAGAALLLGGSLLWGGYTLGMRLAAVTPLSCMMLVTFPSAIVIGVIKACGLVQSNLGTVDTEQIILFSVVQGLGTGVVSTLAYSVAVRHIGPTLSATTGALAPVLTTVMAAPLLGEYPSILTGIGVVVIAAGVALANTSRKKVGRAAVQEDRPCLKHSLCVRCSPKRGITDHT